MVFQRKLGLNFSTQPGESKAWTLAAGNRLSHMNVMGSSPPTVQPGISASWAGSELAACRNRIGKKLLEKWYYVPLWQSAQSQLERIATYLRNHKEAGVVIKGYASPEGSAEVNERIARQRAEAVRNMLVNRYRIAKDRIVAEGQGVGYMFEEPDWNRVSICTINTRPDAAEGK